MYAAFNQVLTWLLQVLHSPAWLVMESDHGVLRRNEGLLRILKQPSVCFADVSPLGEHTLTTHLQLLPRPFNPLLCCIFSEQFGVLLT